jgi:hypothetical protein
MDKFKFDSLMYIPYYSTKALPLLRRLVAGFSPRRPGFEHRSGDLGFAVDKVALGLPIFIQPIALQ